MNKIKQLFHRRYSRCIRYIKTVVSPHNCFALLNWLGIPLIVSYFAGMLVGTPIYHCWAWGKVFDTWAYWQSFSTGILAFSASIVIFNVSRHNAEEQRARNYRAAYSFLPEAFTNLLAYCDQSMGFYGEYWKLHKMDQKQMVRDAGSITLPQLPRSDRYIFKECISVADPKVGKELSHILWELQNSHEWMTSFHKYMKGHRTSIPRIDPKSTEDVFIILYRIVRIRVWIIKNFEFTRDLGKFDDSLGDWNDFEKSLKGHTVNYGEKQMYELPGLDKLFKMIIEEDAKAGKWTYEFGYRLG